MAASVSAVCGIFTSAITAVAIVIVILAIAGMIFVSWGLDNDLFEKVKQAVLKEYDYHINAVK